MDYVIRKPKQLFADNIKQLLYTDLSLPNAVQNSQSHLNHIQTWAA